MNDDDIYLKKVHLASDVYSLCVQHALTTEKQEIMGLLIGDVDDEERISHISAFIILHRNDKQPDRVEISPEQLYSASVYAEQLASKLKKPMRVLGWYHSHPHITVWPSHVDIRTQNAYQTMDKLFVGLIFSVYQSDSIGARSSQVQVTCFQAYQGLHQLERRDVPLEIVHSPLQVYNLNQITELPKILVQEEVEAQNIKTNDIKDDLATLHNDALKTIANVQIVETILLPLCEDLEALRDVNKQRLKELRRMKSEMLKNLN